MEGMFLQAESFNKDLSKWNVQNIRVVNGMFMGALSIKRDYLPKNYPKNTRLGDLLCVIL